MINKIDIGVDVPFVCLGKTYMAVKAIKSDCSRCSFDVDIYFCAKYECIGVYRKDKTNVIFKRV